MEHEMGNEEPATEPVSDGRLTGQILDAIEADARAAGPGDRKDPTLLESLVAEIRALRAERGRLRDSIAEHRRDVMADLGSEEDALPSDSRLWSLLDGEVDDE